ncbi:MAG: FAD:protein FMN transferase [Ferruginibacter sp.]
MAALKVYTDGIPSMSTKLEITILYDEDKQKQAAKIIKRGFAEANRLIALISAWEKGTELYKVNERAGIKPVKVGKELFYLLKRSLKISELTDGLFDVTFASIDKVWYFDRPMITKPTEAEIKNSVRNINYKFIELDEAKRTVYIRNKGTKIELGAIGKGYIVNKIKEVLQANGIESGIVNGGGDLTCWGKNIFGEPWKIGVADPNKVEKYIAWLPVLDGAIATSGSYERYAMIDGIKYSHIIHPKTGYPVSGLHSVTIICPDVELCDAIATSVFLLGKDKGLAFVNQFNDIDCFIVDNENRFYYSDNLKQKKYVEVAD